MNSCPCGSGLDFALCCEPIIKRAHVAPTAEALMRSRYTAFCLKDMDYLERSTHPDFRKAFDRKANQEWAEQAKFTQLEILSAEELDDTAIVVFCAYFSMINAQTPKTHAHQETSTFKRERDTWYFCEGR